MSSDQNPGWLGYIGNITTLCRDYQDPSIRLNQGILEFILLAGVFWGVSPHLNKLFLELSGKVAH